jgi:hypothetical protein
MFRRKSPLTPEGGTLPIRKGVIPERLGASWIGCVVSQMILRLSFPDQDVVVKKRYVSMPANPIVFTTHFCITVVIPGRKSAKDGKLSS